ncbi:MAG TPA: TonB family protein [Cyclobacteriaceae bacterium]|nr:TonB family protein [Cyclobacteriaceae bacterium]HRG79147.1 TonB family protein [Cyclobacteriaceae bacterium]
MALEIKKTEHADLDKKEVFFFSISLFITLIIVLGAFEYKQYDKPVMELVSRNTNTFEEMLDVPATEIPPTPEVIVQQPQLVEVPDEQEIEEEVKFVFDVEVTEDTKIQAVEVIEEPKIVEEETEQIFTIVEVTASPKDGLAAFYQSMAEQIKYPSQARRLRVEGKVFVEFVIGKDGKITEVKAVKGIGAGCDEEAVRIIQNSPPWNPGRQRGKPVRQRMVLPIIFKLANQ